MIAKEYGTALQLRGTLEMYFRRLVRKNKKEAELAIIKLQAILREPQRG